MTIPPDHREDTPIDRLIEPGPPPVHPTPMSSAESELIRRRQRGTARMTGLALAALVVLIFLITVAKQVR